MLNIVETAEFTSVREKPGFQTHDLPHFVTV